MQNSQRAGRGTLLGAHSPGALSQLTQRRQQTPGISRISYEYSSPPPTQIPPPAQTPPSEKQQHDEPKMHGLFNLYSNKQFLAVMQVLDLPDTSTWYV